MASRNKLAKSKRVEAPDEEQCCGNCICFHDEDADGQGFCHENACEKSCHDWCDRWDGILLYVFKCTHAMNLYVNPAEIQSLHLKDCFLFDTLIITFKDGSRKKIRHVGPELESEYRRLLKQINKMQTRRRQQ